MKIEVRASYAATDGSMPEDVSVEVADIDGHYDAAIAAVMPIVEKLITAPGLARVAYAIGAKS